jgi:hypothetical protein
MLSIETTFPLAIRRATMRSRRILSMLRMVSVVFASLWIAPSTGFAQCSQAEMQAFESAYAEYGVAELDVVMGTATSEDADILYKDVEKVLQELSPQCRADINEKRLQGIGKPPQAPRAPDDATAWTNTDAQAYGKRAYETLKSVPYRNLRSVPGMPDTAEIMIDIHVARSGHIERIALISGPSVPGLTDALDKLYAGAVLAPLPPAAPSPVVLRLPIVIKAAEQRR